MYNSQITFTLDTICPWTFVAKKSRRLDKALEQVRASTDPSKIAFSTHFDPYQLNPDFPESANKNEWYLTNKHNGNPEAQKVFQEHMNEQVAPLGLNISFEGEMGNTLHAHRVVQYFQEEKGDETANKIIDGLYTRYFTQGRHPSKDDTLLEACVEAGIDEAEAKKVVDNKELGLRNVKDKLRTVAMDTDAVPVVVFEGKRRDLTLTGAKQIADYVKALETVAKESS
ncbi:hypothetical protein Golomagni_06454 [Golovinomyces magnicellulatus]|nr:hypothetical protein Golomagni_06454 [Golovinomyces magnicellulatus]